MSEPNEKVTQLPKVLVANFAVFPHFWMPRYHNVYCLGGRQTGELARSEGVCAGIYRCVSEHDFEMAMLIRKNYPTIGVMVTSSKEDFRTRALQNLCAAVATDAPEAKFLEGVGAALTMTGR